MVLFHYSIRASYCVREKKSCKSISWEIDTSISLCSILQLWFPWKWPHSDAIRQSTHKKRKSRRESFWYLLSFKVRQIKKHQLVQPRKVARLSSKESALWSPCSQTCKHQPLQDLLSEWRAKANTLSSPCQPLHFEPHWFEWRNSPERK